MITQNDLKTKYVMPLHYKIEPEGNFFRIYVQGEKEWLAVSKMPKVDNPSYTPIAQRFGENAVDFYKQLGWLGHNGIDFQAPNGSCLYAIDDMTIDSYNNENGTLSAYGNEFEVSGQRVKIRFIYGHLDRNIANAGDVIKKGDLIAISDNKGKYTTGAHLHLGIMPYYWNGYWYAERNNGYDGAIDFEKNIDGLTLTLNNMSLKDDIDALKEKKDKSKILSSKYDWKVVQNSVTGQFGLVKGGQLLVCPSERAGLLALTLLLKDRGVVIPTDEWDLLTKVDF